jgi:hypothetical protein
MRRKGDQCFIRKNFPWASFLLIGLGRDKIMAKARLSDQIHEEEALDG